MGKKRDKFKVDKSSASEVTCAAVPDKTKPSRDPVAIPEKIFNAIADYMLQTAAAYRNVFLTMKEYPKICRPKMPRSKATHLVVFCLRLIQADVFNPIAMVEINKRVDYVDKIVVIWKALIQDLSILRLIVIGSISPASELFHRALDELIERPYSSDDTDPIIYSVWPYKEILHIYDAKLIMEDIQNMFYERGEIVFLTRSDAESFMNSPHKWDVYCANWKDIVAALTLNLVKCAYTSESSSKRHVHIFNAAFEESFKKYVASDSIPTSTRDSTRRLLSLLIPFAEFLEHNVHVHPRNLQVLYDQHENLRIALATARFGYFYTDTFSDDGASEEDNTKFECNVIPAKLQGCVNKIREKLPVEKRFDAFDMFLRKMIVDDYKLFKNSLKSCQDAGAEVPEIADFSEEGSNCARILHEYFQSLLQQKISLTSIESAEKKPEERSSLESNPRQPDQPEDSPSNTPGDPVTSESNIAPEAACLDEEAIKPDSDTSKTERDRAGDLKLEHITGKISNDTALNLQGLQKALILRRTCEPQTVQESGRETTGTPPLNIEEKCSLNDSGAVDSSDGDTKNPRIDPSTPQESPAKESPSSSKHGAIPKVRKKPPDSGSEEPDAQQEIDYRAYRNELLLNLSSCDKDDSDSDDNFIDREKFNDLISLMPDQYETLRLTNDWLCTFNGYVKLKEIVERRQARIVKSKLFCLEHIDFFINTLSRTRSEDSSFDWEVYKFMDSDSAHDAMRAGEGVYVLSEDD